MKTSGHTDKFIKKVTLRGLTNYAKKKSFLKVGEPGYQPLYMGSSWKKNERKKAKVLSKRNWYRGVEGTTDADNKEGGMNGSKHRMRKKVQKVGKCSTVMFVPNTRGGKKVKRERDCPERHH
jgi:hypothetical protein